MRSGVPGLACWGQKARPGRGLGSVARTPVVPAACDSCEQHRCPWNILGLNVSELT